MESHVIRLLIVRALTIVLIYALCNALGLRDYMSVISGTSPDPDGVTLMATLKAVIYLLAFLATFIVVPVLLISSALIFVWSVLRKRLSISTGNISELPTRMPLAKETVKRTRSSPS